MSALRSRQISTIILLVFGLIFISSGLVINFLQLGSLVFWPLNRKFYRKVNCRLAYCLWSQLVVILEWWSGSELTIFTDSSSRDKMGEEKAIVILNHSFEIDFLCGWTLLERLGLLGSSKVLIKKELSWVPVVGWMYYFVETAFCKRKWEEDKQTLVKNLNSLADFPELFCFSLFCEGTRFTEEKHRISMEVAQSKGLPKLKYHLLPRTKGFATVVRCLRGTASAVYDVTLNFRGHRNPSLPELFRREKYEADIYFRRYPLEEIPLEDNEIAQWLHKLYQEKDALQEFYNDKGMFPGMQIKLCRRPWALLNFFFWATVVLFSLFKLAAAVFLSGSPLLILIFLGLFAGAFFGIHRLVGVTKIENASAYGN